MLINSAEQVVRSSCTTLPLLGEKGHDIRSCTAELGAAMVNELQFDATVFGINVQRVAIVEARYAHEISAQMLMKQQAVAMVDARKSAWRRLRERGGGACTVRAACTPAALPPQCDAPLLLCPADHPHALGDAPTPPHNRALQPSWQARSESCGTRCRSSPRCPSRPRSA